MHACARHGQYLIQNFSYLFLAQIICYDLISIPAINKF
jgi:hypothetical protein